MHNAFIKILSYFSHDKMLMNALCIVMFKNASYTDNLKILQNAVEMFKTQ